MAKILKLGAVLFVITAITGLVLGGVYTMTLEPIKTAKEKEKMEALAQTLPEASDFEAVECPQGQSVIKEVNRGSANGETVGYNITVTPKGYGGLIEMVVGISDEGRLTDIKILSHTETPGLGAKAADPAFSGQFHEKIVEKIVVTTTPPAADNEIQAISGATITSEAVASGVNAALGYWAKKSERGGELAMMSPLRLLKNGILTENPTFVLVLGLCPTLAVTSSASNGFGMGLAATAVLMGSNVMISMIRKFIPDEIRIPAFIVVIAGFVTIIQLLISAYAPALDKSLGIFIPLIVVNCIILARAEAFAFKNGVIESLFDGIGMGLGFTFALTFIGSIRELLGNGTVFNFSLIPAFYQPALLAILAPGGFITLGILIALFRNLQLRKEEESTGFKADFDGWEKLDACDGCALKKYCGGGGLSVPCAKKDKEGDA